MAFSSHRNQANGIRLLNPTVLAIVTLVLLATLAVKRIATAVRHRRLAAANGCAPAPRLPMWDHILGIDELLRRVNKLKEHKLLEYTHNSFTSRGIHTYSNTQMGFNAIFTIEPENLKTMLSLKFKDYGLGVRQNTLGRLLGRGIFVTDGEPWAHSRALIRPNFTRDQVADLAAFERHIQTLLKLLPRDGSTVDLQQYFFRFTIDSATEFLFGQGTHSLKASLAHDAAANSEADFAANFNRAQEAVANRIRFGPFGSLYRDPAGDKAIRACHDFVDQFVVEAVQYRQKVDAGLVHDDKYVFLHELAKATTDRRQLRDELLNVLLAGRDTTASLLSNMWFMLAEHPDVFAKLRAEVDGLQGRAPTYQQLRNMQYLKYCMNESLRLHPVVPANSRLACTDTILPVGGGPDGKAPLFVPRGTIVSYFTYSMHRRTDLYGADADAFRPERWENLRTGWEYLPFNGGPRICLGQQYALTEAGYVTVRLLQEFKACQSRAQGPWTESLSLTLCSHGGTQVSLTPA